MSKIKDSFFGGAEKRAGKIQARASEAAIAEQRKQFDITQQQFAPFRQAGLSSLQQQLALLGLPGLQPEQFAQPVAAPAPAPAIQQDLRGGQFRAAADRARLAAATAGQADTGGPQVQPGEFAFPEAVSREQALAAFAETPGQQFLRERQERSLLRSAGAIGGLGGGNIRTALQEQAFGRAATQLGEFQNRLAGLTGGAQTATMALGQLGAQTAGQIGAGLQAAGAARATGIIGQAAGFRRGVAQVAQLAGGFGGFGGAGVAPAPQFVPGSLQGIGAGSF